MDSPYMPFTAGSAPFWKRFWLPIASAAALGVACTDTNYQDGRHIAVMLSGEANKFFIALGVLFLLGIAWRRRTLWPVRWIIEFSLLCLVTVNVLRLIPSLPRPPHMHHGLAVAHDTFSAGFPSSHTAFAFGLAWLLFEIKPALAVPFFALAVAIGWSRIEMFVHYPYQVLCGAALGMALGYWVSHSSQGITASLLSLRKNHKPAPAAALSSASPSTLSSSSV